jgi:hypothetical protein
MPVPCARLAIKETQMPVKIFLSHTSEFAHIAKSLRMSMLALSPSPVDIDVRVNEEMAGGTKWREWINLNTRDADAFIYLYPSATVDNGWPGYELARFTVIDEKTVVSIRNPDLKLPGMFDQYQGYEATEDSILKFFRDVFVKGLFSKGEPLNDEVGNVAGDYYDTARTAARELAELFANASIKPQYYTRRIQLSLAYDRNHKLDPAQSQVDGNAEGMKLLGMRPDALVSWSAVSAMLGDSVEWPSELEREIPSLVSGALPPHLSPFSNEHGIFIPLISKSEVVQSLLRRLTVLFVEANSQKLRPMFEWKMPDAMPGQLATFVLLVRLILRIRFDILEPRFLEAKYRAPSRDECVAMSQTVIEEYDEVQVESKKIGIPGVSAFEMLFDKSLSDKVETATSEYLVRIRALQAYPKQLDARGADADHAGMLAELLQSLRENNAHWLAIVAAQFTLLDWR